MGHLAWLAWVSVSPLQALTTGPAHAAARRAGGARLAVATSARVPGMPGTFLLVAF